MNIRRYLVACFAVWIFVFLFDLLLHGVLLKDLYVEAKDLWRPREEMLHYAPWLILGQGGFAFIFGFIFLRGYENQGIMEGLRFGFFIGLLFAPMSVAMYAVEPISLKIITAWIFGGIAEASLAGIVLASVYRPLKSTSAAPLS